MKLESKMWKYNEVFTDTQLIRILENSMDGIQSIVEEKIEDIF